MTTVGWSKLWVCALGGTLATLATTPAWGESYHVSPIRQIGTATTVIDIDFGRMGINGAGEIAFTDFDENRAYVWLGHENTEYAYPIPACEPWPLPLPAGATESTAHDISDFGLVTGSAKMSSGEHHAIVWNLRDATITDLADPTMFSWDTSFIDRPVVAWSVNDNDPDHPQNPVSTWLVMPLGIGRTDVQSNLPVATRQR